MAQKVVAQGGNGGSQWDDGSEHDAVTKIQVSAGGKGIEYVKFDYVKNGQTKEAPLRSVKGRALPADPVRFLFTILTYVFFIFITREN